MAQKTVTAASVLPITLEEVKQHLRVDGDDEDALLFAYLRAETDWAENYLNRALVTQTRDVFLAEWPIGNAIECPRPPLQSVTSISYTTQGSTLVYASTLSSTAYRVDTDSEPGRVVLKESQSWPTSVLETGNPIRVRYTAGYGAMGSNVPEQIRVGILLNIGEAFENRENSITGTIYERTRAAERLLHPLRVYTAP